MPKDSSRTGDPHTPISIQSVPVRSEKPVVGKLTGHWPFIVENTSMALTVADSLSLVCKDSSQFIT